MPRRSYAGPANPMYGKHHTRKTKRLISKAKKGIKLGSMPLEARVKISKALKGRKVPWTEKLVQRNFAQNYHFGYVLGAILGDGSLYIGKRSENVVYLLSLGARDEDFVEGFCHHYEMLTKRKAKTRSYYKSGKLFFQASPANKGLYQLFFPIKHHKDFQPLFTLTKEAKKGFLAGIIDSEGHITCKGRRVIVTNEDIALLNAVQNILKTFDISSDIYVTVQKGGFKINSEIGRLQIRSINSLRRLRQLVQLHIVRKEEQLSQINDLKIMPRKP